MYSTLIETTNTVYRMTKKNQIKEAMCLLYKKVDARLYGCISFFREEYPSQENLPLVRQSDPFVIGRYSADGRLEVLGSVDFMLKEIRRLIQAFIKTNHDWNTRQERDGDTYDPNYDRAVRDFLVLVSSHARNVIDLFNRFNNKRIPRLDYSKSSDGEVTLRELFDTLIHHRYYYFDGGYVRDLFSADFKKKQSALSGRFMGYAFEIGDFIRAVSELIEDVRVKDLTQLLRREFKALTALSAPQKVVFLIQNLHAFSDLMATKIPHSDYDFMTGLMFDDEYMNKHLDRASKNELPDGTVVESVGLFMEAPHITISPELDKKELEIRVRRAVGTPGDRPDMRNLKEHKATVKYDKFFRMANEAFGSDRMLAMRTDIHSVDVPVRQSSGSAS